MKVEIGEFTYYLGEKVKLYHDNLNMGEYYVEHTQINPDRYSLWKKSVEITIENSWKIEMTDNPKIESAYKTYLRNKKIEEIIK